MLFLAEVSDKLPGPEALLMVSPLALVLFAVGATYPRNAALLGLPFLLLGLVAIYPEDEAYTNALMAEGAAGAEFLYCRLPFLLPLIAWIAGIGAAVLVKPRFAKDDGHSGSDRSTLT